MSYELTQRFYFEAAHTLQREIDAEPSRRIHGHTYHAAVTVSGTPSPDSGMVIDLQHLRAEIARVREQLDHRLLDGTPGLGPATLENLCRFIHAQLAPRVAGITRVEVSRQASGDSCALVLAPHRTSA